jgi:hypothetical protein
MKGNLYTLEASGSAQAGAEEVKGTARVQKLDRDGNFLGQFSLGNDLPLDQPSRPERLAVDGGDNVFVTFPKAGLVRQFGPTVEKLQIISYLTPLASRSIW